VSGQKTTSIHVVMDPVANAHNYEVTPYMYWAEDGYLVVDYTTKPDASMSLWYDNYHLPDPAFILQWLDGSCTFGKEYSKDIVIEPPYAHAGDTVEITAKVRNFSLSPTSPFKVDFYQGDPDSGGVKIHREDEVSLGARGVESVSFEWEATGIGEQQIYAVIDPDNELVEVHDETDPNINNNKAFGRVVIGAARFMDPGPAAFRPYDALNLTGGPRNLDITAYVPLSSFEEVKLFELTHLEYGGSVAGDLFELAVYDEDGDKISNLSLQEMPHSPPTAIAIAYGDSTIIDEINNLKLYIFDERKALWNEVKCEPYEILRFPEDNLIIVPVCQTGIFALLEGAPSWLPVADFSANPTHGTAPLDVTFKDESTGYPDSWEWDFGDGAGSMEQHPSHTYTATGTYAVTLTVSNELGSDTMVDPDCVTVTEAGKKEMYLPLILKSAGPPGPGGPDLVVKELTASSNAITLVIKNQGDASVTDDFWVDAYVAPREPPRLNKIWQAIAEQGLAWGVTDPIAPGGELTLTIGGAYYVPGESEFSGMAPGTPVWAQVDAVNYQTSYGSVLEKNEANNLFGPVSAVASQAGVVAPPSVEGGEPVPVDEGLPGRR
jgi:PKD repeat protein